MTQKGKRGRVVHLTTHLKLVLTATVPLMQVVKLLCMHNMLCTHNMELGVHDTEQ